jgi:hypothetical protein
MRYETHTHSPVQVLQLSRGTPTYAKRGILSGLYEYALWNSVDYPSLIIVAIRNKSVILNKMSQTYQVLFISLYYNMCTHTRFIWHSVTLLRLFEQVHHKLLRIIYNRLLLVHEERGSLYQRTEDDRNCYLADLTTCLYMIYIHLYISKTTFLQ